MVIFELSTGRYPFAVGWGLVSTEKEGTANGEIDNQLADRCVEQRLLQCSMKFHEEVNTNI
jgi:hypothetical protein